MIVTSDVQPILLSVHFCIMKVLHFNSLSPSLSPTLSFSLLKVLSEGGQDPAGGIILLITDGEERERPFIADVIDFVSDSGVIVDTLAFTQYAESTLPDLSLATGKSLGELKTETRSMLSNLSKCFLFLEITPYPLKYFF